MKRSAFEERVAQRVLVGDGAMGTMLYQHGVFLNRCFDELNLTDAKLVRGVHEGYVEAGADFIETNTFGANRLKLSKFGLAGEVGAINRAGVRIAREAAKGDTLVAGAIGPLGCELTEHGPITPETAEQVFLEQGRALVEGGADLLILETFSNTEELLTAIRAVAGLGEVPILAQMTVNENSETIYGERIDLAIAKIEREEAVTAVGLNCSVGPSGMLASLELIRHVTHKPIVVQPNAGMPRSIEGRQLYMCTPEYMAEYAKRFFEKGARIIGGCCGTTPDHIREIVRAVRSISRAATGVVVSVGSGPRVTAGPALKEPTPLVKRSGFGAKLAAGEAVTTIEITPPRGVDVTAILDKARRCAEAGVDAINIPDGPRASSRLSPLVTAVRIQQDAGIEAILHFCCRDRNLIGMQSDLLGASAIGVHNLLIITGDPPKLGEYPSATGVFDMDSVALTGVARNLNRGVDIGGNGIDPPTSLVIGVGANPVAADLDREIDRFKQKVLAGAEFAITQPVFDPDCLSRFLEATQECHIPIIAGIWPFTSFKNAEFMANEVPGVVVPPRLLDRMSRATTKEQGRVLGIEIAQELVEQIRPHVAGFAVSAPFGNVATALAVLGKVDIGVV
ncbi:MAG: bifunctional homocysteine S-methyltransferase/methylenetetrahydrofolate reductase [Phycisphaerae bacterium]|nr:bifunctional homocysteine S-methyltransferase/methylenetetrahydrofolate reductase [Phycisphaerae bacterium]